MVSKSETKNQMNELYPIIRRVRRPLVPVVEGTAGGADAKPVEHSKPDEAKASINSSGHKDAKSNVKTPRK